MKNQFWAVGCGLGWTVKKRVWADYEQLLRPIFSLFRGQKISLNFFWKYHSVRTEKLQRKKVKKNIFSWEDFFSEKTFFLGLKFEWNLSVNTERLGTDYCWLYILWKKPFLLFFCTGILGIFDILQFEIPSLTNWIFFLVWKQTGYFYQFKLTFFPSFWARVKFIPFLQFTEIYITSFWSGGFTTPTAVNQRNGNPGNLFTLKCHF